jgi:sugar diacid utilization regulator
VDSLLSNPTLPALRRLTRRGGQQSVGRVFLAEAVRDVEQAPSEGLVILSRTASSEAIDYRLDMALRWASLRGAVAMAIFSSAGIQTSITALDLAERTGLTLITIPEETDLASLISAIGRVIDGGADLALARAELSLRAIASAETAGEGSSRLVKAASEALGVSIDAREPGPGDYGVPVALDRDATTYSCALPRAWAFATASRLVVQALAGATARLEERTHRDLESPSRSRSDLLGELLVADEAHATELIDWARRLGLPIDGWHVVVRIEIDNLARLQRDELGHFELLAHAAKDALQTAVAGGDGWYLARAVGVIVLVHMSKVDPGPQAGMADAGVARLALDGLATQFTEARFRAGVGASHEGLPGLRASALEARAALLAMGRVARGQPAVMAFDAVGIRRMLLEWYTSETAREAVRVQLAPLERLGSPKSDIAIRTLQTYLDQQGSIGRTARALHLHRNAVSYRLQRIFELLDVDASDPDQRLAIQLACRARLMW